MWSEADRRHMQTALALAARGVGEVEPNPMVGAVVVRDEVVLGEGFHRAFGGPHAEVVALRHVRSRGGTCEGATMYVTLEPCAHYGKTPPCAPSVAEAGISRVVVATLDPTALDPAKCGTDKRRGTAILQGAGVQTEVGLCREEAAVLNAAFFKRNRTGLPLVIAKWAMSADGKIATRSGESRWISCPDSRRLVHELRGRVDAIVVGSGTAVRDNPLLTCREARASRAAARVVLCGRTAPAANCNLARTAEQAPVLLAYVADAAPEGLDALAEHGCELLPLPPAEDNPRAIDVGKLLLALGARGASNVLVEGGRQVLGSLFDRRLVDRAMIFVAPFILGGSEAVTAVGGKGVESIKAAIPLVGQSFLPFSEDARPSSLLTTARPVGRDLLLEFWTNDPLQWAPF